MEIYFVTAHGRYRLDYDSMEQTIEELCLSNRIPAQSVVFYGYESTSGPSRIIVGQHQSIFELTKQFERIYIRPDRNIDYKSICQKPIKRRKVVDAVAEYTFPSQCALEKHHFEFNQEQCCQYVTQAVSSFLEKDVSINKDQPIIVGVSGGGDSNSLINALICAGISNKQIKAVMMLGIPDWDKGQERAKTICQQQNVELQFIKSQDVNDLLGRKTNGDWVHDFEQAFPDADLEVLGTLAIRLSLMSVAKKENAQAIITGLNLEDILAECLLCVMQGQLPPPFPVRMIDSIPVWYPLYRIPKKILDGCHPNFSLANYNDRYPSKMIARANVYYLAQSLHTCLPGSEFDMLEGFKSLAETNNNYCLFDKELGFSASGNIPFDLKQQWFQFLDV